MGSQASTWQPANLSVSLFGKLLFLTIAQNTGRTRLPSVDDLGERIVKNLKDAPAAIAKVLHLDATSNGKLEVREMTEYVYAAQRAGLVSRENPSYIAGNIQIGAVEAQILVEKYKKSFPDVMVWLASCFDSHSMTL